MKFIKEHRNYVVGFIVWVLAIASVIAIPKIITAKRNQKVLSSFGKFMSTLSPEQKARLVSFDGGIISIGDKYYLIDTSTQDEFNLHKNDMIEYRELPAISDENTRRLAIVNTILKNIVPEERDQIFARKAAIVFRNNEFILIKARSGSSTSK
jgi:hypothetical protein